MFFFPIQVIASENSYISYADSIESNFSSAFDHEIDDSLSVTSDFDYTFSSIDKSESSIDIDKSPSTTAETKQVYICLETFSDDNDETINLDFLDRVELIHNKSEFGLVKKMKTCEIGLVPMKSIELLSDFLANA